MTGDPPATIGAALEAAAKEGTFLVEGPDGRFSAEAFARAAEAVAAALAEWKLARGEAVGILAENGAHAAAAYFAVFRQGGAAVPIPVHLAPDEAAGLLERTEARIVLCTARMRDAAAAVVERLGETARRVEVERAVAAGGTVEAPFVHPEDIAAIYFTSGTTGRPKGVMLSHRALLADARASRAAFDFGPEDAFTTAIPLYHCFALTVALLLPMVSGGRARLFPREAFAEGLSRDAGTIVGVPALLEALRDGSVRVGGAVRVISGGAALEPSLRRALPEALGVPVFEGYGTTECAPVVSVQRPGAVGPPEAVGRPLDGVFVEIRDAEGAPLPRGTVGEVCVGGPILMSGYYDLPEVTSRRMRGGFFHTGDLGFLDEDGYLHIVDRIADTFHRQGLTIYPHEIEEVLAGHPEVAEAAVLGSPDGAGHEVPVAVCVPRAYPPREGLAEDLVAFAAARLPAFKVPARVEFRASLPKTATGKVVKRALRQKWA